MNKSNDKVNLIAKYKQLKTKKEKKQFILMWSTVIVCLLTVTFVCCSIFYTINLNKNNLPNQINTQIDNQNNKNQQQNNNNQSKDQSIIAQNSDNKQNEVAKDTKSDTNSVIDLADGVNINKPIYAGAKTTHAAITFDDGYNKKYVEKVLDTLKKNNVKSTFFIIGDVLDNYPEVWKRAINEGHQICNHTQSHQILTKLSDATIQKEISGWEASCKKVLGQEYFNRMKKDFPYIRLPGGGGAKSNRVLAIAQKNGYKVIGWNLETVSSVINPLKNKKSVSQISDRIQSHVVNRCYGGSIILLHFNQYDMGNIEQIVSGLKNRGFELKTITQMIK